MKGIALGEVRDALVEAFNRESFDMLLSDRFEFNRQQEIGGDNLGFKKVVFDVLQRFSEEGKDAYLVAEAAAQRPHKGDVQRVYGKYARALVGEAWTTKVESAGIGALERYGQLPLLQIQRRGQRASAGIASIGDGGFQRIIRTLVPQLDGFVWATNLLKVMRRVCLIEVDGVAEGTGFLVGPDVVLTNNHVLQSSILDQVDGNSIRCLFEYWKRPDGLDSEGVGVAARSAFAEWHVDSSGALAENEERKGEPEAEKDQLDHALLRLERPVGDEPIFPGGPIRGWIRVPATPPALAPDTPMAILQHPNGRPMKLAFDTQAVLSVNPKATRVRYAANTESGASGAPCFSIDLALVALHHFGDPGRPRPTIRESRSRPSAGCSKRGARPSCWVVTPHDRQGRRMFRVTEVPADGPKLWHYRQALLKVFSPEEFKEFLQTRLNVTLDHEVGSALGLDAVLFKLLDNFARVGILKELLVEALRVRARNSVFVRTLAGLLGLSDLVELAAGLADRHCSREIREAAIESVRFPGRELRRTIHENGVEGWIDALVWLDDLPALPGSPPPLVSHLQRVHSLWQRVDRENATYLGTWLDQRGLYGEAPPVDAASPLRGVLVELQDTGGTQCVVTAYLLADNKTPPVMLSARSFTSRDGEPKAELINASLETVADDCLAEPLVSEWLSKGKPFRFEFLLPTAWLSIPVDQLEIAGDGDNDAAPIGSSYPVLIRPGSWCRPKKQSVRTPNRAPARREAPGASRGEGQSQDPESRRDRRC